MGCPCEALGPTRCPLDAVLRMPNTCRRCGPQPSALVRDVEAFVRRTIRPRSRVSLGGVMNRRAHDRSAMRRRTARGGGADPPRRPARRLSRSFRLQPSGQRYSTRHGVRMAFVHAAEPQFECAVSDIDKCCGRGSHAQRNHLRALRVRRRWDGVLDASVPRWVKNIFAGRSPGRSSRGSRQARRSGWSGTGRTCCRDSRLLLDGCRLPSDGSDQGRRDDAPEEVEVRAGRRPR